MKYEFLSDDDKKREIDNRLRAAEADHFRAELMVIENPDGPGTEMANQQLADAEKRIESLRKERG